VTEILPESGDVPESPRIPSGSPGAVGRHGSNLEIDLDWYAGGAGGCILPIRALPATPVLDGRGLKVPPTLLDRADEVIE
jgi:hypothetical protein